MTRTLKSYEEMGYFNSDLFKVEVCICDDASDREPLPFNYGERWPVRIYWNEKDLQHKDRFLNPCVPINLALEMAKGDLIVLTEPEVYHTAPVLEDMLKLVVYGQDVIVCPCKSIGHKGIPWYSHPVHKRRPSWWFRMHTREMQEKIGPWDEDYRYGIGWDDDDNLERMKKEGAVFKWLDNGKYVTHPYSPKIPMYKGKYQNNKALFTSKWGINRKHMADDS